MEKELTIDYVLVYESVGLSDTSTRNQFESKLKQVGLVLSTEEIDMSHESTESNRKLNFVKIHAPNNLLEGYCERLKMKMPIKNEQQSTLVHEQQPVWSFFNCAQVHSTSPHILKSVFSIAKRDLFAIENVDFFSPTIRIEVVNYILNKTSFLGGPDDSEAGSNIQKLLVDKVYKAAYPLHAGRSSGNVENERADLNRKWATLKVWNREQPLDKIKEYFGVQVGLYFAWLGFYTKMLVPLALVGVVCFLYGLIEVFTDPINEAIKNSNIKMCPKCDGYETRKLADMFSQLKWRNLFDSKLVPFFAAVVAIWSTLFFEVWKRYSARLLFKWDMTDYMAEIEPPRPDYIHKVKKSNIKKRNFITNEEEFIPQTKKIYRAYLINYSTVLFFICLAVVAIVAIKIVKTVSKGFFDSLGFFAIFAPGLINLVIIMLLNKVYNFVAKWLTDQEFHRTQTEYDDNLALKIYLFQFVNYYTSLFYLAFVQGNIIGYPGNYVIETSSQNYCQEECQNGCFMDLSIQLAIIMVGKQMLGTFKEMLPFFLDLWKNIWQAKQSGLNESPKQWVRDFYLTPLPESGLFSEYLEMVIQFGFITIFAVFPLAPLFALLNNMFEIRLDAEKFVSFYRRTNPVRTASIGIWYKILEFLQKICVISNGLIVAFTSSFIDKFVYYINFHGFEYDYNHAGYLNHTLSYYSNGTYSCNYFDYRYSGDKNYEHTPEYWKLLTFRLLFVILFQNMICLIQLLVDWAVPDVPQDVQDGIKKDAFWINKVIYKEEEFEDSSIDCA